MLKKRSKKKKQVEKNNRFVILYKKRVITFEKLIFPFYRYFSSMNLLHLNDSNLKHSKNNLNYY